MSTTQPNMTEQTLPNGLPPQFGKLNITSSPISFNGMDSSHSSRTSSPGNRLQQIPASQLPPTRKAIPPSQLPPSGTHGANINQLSQNYSNLSVSQVTPMSSPNVQPFITSTPASERTGPANSDLQQQNRNFSPIPNTAGNRQSFTHSAQSQFANVPLNAGQFQNIPLRQELKPSNTKAESNNSTQPHTGYVGASKRTDNETATNNSSQDQLRIGPAGVNMHVSSFFNKTSQAADLPALNQPKMQPSLSQPLFETTLGNVSMPNSALPPKTVPNFGSTPNLQQQFNQTPGPRQNLNHSYTNGNSQTSVAPPTQASYNFNTQSSVAPTSVQFLQPQMQTQQTIGMQPQPGKYVPTQSKTQSYLQQPQQPIAPKFVPHNQQPPSSMGSYANPPQLIQTNAPPTPGSTNAGIKANLHANRYPTAQHFSSSPNMQFSSQPQQQPVQNAYQNQSQYGYQSQNKPINSYNVNDQQYQNYQQSNVVQGGFNKLWGQENYDLLQYPTILPDTKVEPPRISLGQDFLDAANCSPDIFRCTMTKIPETNTLLQKARLPLGILIHPFKDLDHLPVIQCSTIVRCRSCRTYINPFVFFVDMKRWKCNLCYRVNELPEEFQFDPVSKTYGDPSRRPEIKSSTIEYIAPSEYMLRPPQPAVYLFLLDVSHAAVESGYLHTFCNVLSSNLSSLPGDARTQVGFIAYNSALHFYSLAEGLSQPHEMTVLDIDDVFLPCPDNLIVNLQERKELVSDLLAQLPTRYNSSFDTGSALGAALQAAHKMIASTGGRITVFQASLPSVGPGALTVREDPNQRSSAEVQHLNPANDFYKRLALECSGQQIAVDLFVVNSQYVDLATISGISRFSGGCMHHFPLFKANRTLQAESLERTLKRYLVRKIGFEAVMRIRCTRGLSIHTFHGNFFVRSTDLLSLPNVNPEAGFGMQVAIDESLSDLHTVCFQAALLYTSSKGERRIRVHTLCVPIASTLPDVLAAADQQCIVGLLAKMAVDRSMQSSLADAREAFINVAIDIMSSYKLSLNLGSPPSGLLAPGCLKLLPLYISALLKHIAFRSGTSTRLDDRVKAMCDMKTLPLYLLIQQIYPDLYPVHNLEDQNTTLNVDGEAIPQPPRLQLSARSLDSKGAFLLDMGEHMVLLVGPSVSPTFLNEALGVPDYNSISEQMYDLPNLDTPHNQRLNNFINYLNDEKPFVATLQIVRENSPSRGVFIEHLIEDRIETALSYHEFLQHLKTQVK